MALRTVTRLANRLATESSQALNAACQPIYKEASAPAAMSTRLTLLDADNADAHGQHQGPDKLRDKFTFASGNPPGEDFGKQ